MAEKPRITSRVYLLKIDRIREKKKRLIYQERKNKKQNLSDYDLISRLPEDILLSIMSRLSMRDAIRTSILSTTWKKLSRKYLKSLKNIDFDITELVMPLLHKDAFVRCVDRIFHLHCGTIEFFRMTNGYLSTELYTRHIDNWIKLAMKKKVEKIELNLSREIEDLHKKWAYWSFYNFPKQLFTGELGKEYYYSALKHLSLTSCILNPPSDSTAFSLLISLTLNRCYVRGEYLVNILSCCSSLEWFRMEHCWCYDVMTFTRGRKLKHLNIHFCRFLNGVDISGAENLTSFEYGGLWLPREFVCRGILLPRYELAKNNGVPVKRLAFHILSRYLSESVDNVFSGIASEFPQIESLILTLPTIVEATYQLPAIDQTPANVATFNHLKQLNLILRFKHPENLWEVTYTALKASPFLHKLELHSPQYMGADRQIEDISLELEGFRHDNLREVTMNNFRGQAREVELLMYLANCALSIEKIQINRSAFFYEGDGKWCDLKDYSSKIKRSQVLEMLRKRLPAAIKLQVL